LLLQIKKRTAFPHEISPTRGPPDPLFHRRWWEEEDVSRVA
jgi:hypothetical protein